MRNTHTQVNRQASVARILFGRCFELFSDSIIKILKFFSMHKLANTKKLLNQTHPQGNASTHT